MVDLQVAQAIFNQLGGKRFTKMTGAKDYVVSANSLTFRLPARFAKAGINRVTITLDPSDTYIVEGVKITRRNGDWKSKPVEKRELVYAEDLQTVFTAMTGLDTHLPTIIFKH